MAGLTQYCCTCINHLPSRSRDRQNGFTYHTTRSCVCLSFPRPAGFKEDAGRGLSFPPSLRKRARRERERDRAWASWRRRGTTASTSSEHDVVDVVLHLLVPRPAALAGGAGGGRDRDRAGYHEERELLACARRTRDSSTGTPPWGVNQRTHGC
jgi:hypothetical protein